MTERFFEEKNFFALNSLGVSDKSLAFVIPNLMIYETLSPILDEARVDFDLLIPRNNAETVGWQEMAKYTYEVLNEKGFHPRWLEDVKNVVYECVVSPYWGFEVNTNKHIRILYGLAKHEWNFDYWNIFYDLILTYGPYDTNYLKGYSQTLPVGPIKFAKFEGFKKARIEIQDKWGLNPDVKTILYLPTYGEECSIDRLVPTLEELNLNYNLIVKLHQGTYHLEQDRTQKIRGRFITATHGDSLVELLAIADLVISDGSGAIFESLLANVPIIIFQPTTPKKCYGKTSLEEEIISTGILPTVHTPQDIHNLIQLIFETDNYSNQRDTIKKRLFTEIKPISFIWERIIDLMKTPLNEVPGYYSRQSLRTKILNDLSYRHTHGAIVNITEEIICKTMLDWRSLVEANTRYEIQLSAYDEQIKTLLKDINNIRQQKEDIVKVKDKQIQDIYNQFNEKYNTLSLIYSSKGWKIVAFYWSIKQFTKKVIKKLFFINYIRSYRAKKLNKEMIQRYKKEVDSIIKKHKDIKGIIIYPPTIDWGFLFQRPQQLAIAFSKLGYLFFYCTQNYNVDNVHGFVKERENLYLSNVPMETFEDINSPVLLVSWTVNKKFVNYFKNPKVIYDYIDDLNVFHQYDQKMIDDHHKLIKDASIVTATADKLFREVKQFRPDALLCPNAVDYEVFHLDENNMHIKVPADINDLVNLGRKIIGYYGALAEWFDYDLVEYIAEKRPDYHIILIGPDYDGSIHKSNVFKFPNVSWLGSKDYNELPYYLFHFDVATIPFKVNQITEATSPVKLFEYMAGNRPIVTTGMPECKKYKSVLVSLSYEEFVSNLDKAIQLKEDSHYQKLLKEDALANTWTSRAEQIISAIEGVKTSGGK